MAVRTRFDEPRTAGLSKPARTKISASMAASLTVLMSWSGNIPSGGLRGSSVLLARRWTAAREFWRDGGRPKWSGVRQVVPLECCGVQASRRRALEQPKPTHLSSNNHWPDNGRVRRLVLAAEVGRPAFIPVADRQRAWDASLHVSRG
jgi:hypothetical protein